MYNIRLYTYKLDKYRSCDILGEKKNYAKCIIIWLTHTDGNISGSTIIHLYNTYDEPLSLPLCLSLSWTVILDFRHDFSKKKKMSISIGNNVSHAYGPLYSIIYNTKWKIRTLSVRTIYYASRSVEMC